jgi:riboflavin biosynthesis pyrimidine reductase
MPSADPDASGTGGPSEPLLKGLDPPAEPLPASAVAERLGLWDRPSDPPPRPRVLLNMVATADGRATLSGRSGPVSGAADRALFHALRAASDAILVGAGTIRTERYGRVLRDPSLRELRERRGLEPEPMACIVSGRLALGEDIPLLREPGSRVAILTASEASVPELGAQIEYVRSPGAQLDLPAAIAELAGRFAIFSLLCEGGPHLARELLAAQLVDEIFLTISPLLAGGEPSGGEALRILAGAELEPAARLELLGVMSSDSYVFLRYAVSR